MNKLWLQRGAEHLHALGPRAIAEFLDDIGKTHRIDGDIERRLLRYRERLTPEMLRAVGGDKFPAPFAPVPKE